MFMSFEHRDRKLIFGVRSIRFAPPLVISEEDVRKAVKIIGESLEEFDTVSRRSPSLFGLTWSTELRL
jgi:hypothetical protein